MIYIYIFQNTYIFAGSDNTLSLTRTYNVNLLFNYDIYIFQNTYIFAGSENTLSLTRTYNVNLLFNYDIYIYFRIPIYLLVLRIPYP